MQEKLITFETAKSSKPRKRMCGSNRLRSEQESHRQNPFGVSKSKTNLKTTI